MESLSLKYIFRMKEDVRNDECCIMPKCLPVILRNVTRETEYFNEFVNALIKAESACDRD